MDDTEQARLGDADEPIKEPAEKETEQRLTDLGEPQGPWRTKGGLNRFTVSSALQKAVRRSDEEVAAWAAWELARSSFHSNLWDRLNLYCVEDLAAGQDAVLQIARYEELATKRWNDDEWRQLVCAIHAALTAARAHSSRESPNAHGYFKEVAKERAAAQKEGRVPSEKFPVDDELELGGRYDVVLDRHSKQGKSHGRDWEHFLTRAVRVGPAGESNLSSEWHRKRLRLKYGDEIDEELVDHATSAVDPDTRWEEDREGPDSLDKF